MFLNWAARMDNSRALMSRCFTNFIVFRHWPWISDLLSFSPSVSNLPPAGPDLVPDLDPDPDPDPEPHPAPSTFHFPFKSYRTAGLQVSKKGKAKLSPFPGFLPLNTTPSLRWLGLQVDIKTRSPFFPLFTSTVSSSGRQTLTILLHIATLPSGRIPSISPHISRTSTRSSCFLLLVLITALRRFCILRILKTVFFTRVRSSTQIRISCYHPPPLPISLHLPKPKQPSHPLQPLIFGLLLLLSVSIRTSRSSPDKCEARDHGSLRSLLPV